MISLCISICEISRSFFPRHSTPKTSPAVTAAQPNAGEVSPEVKAALGQWHEENAVGTSGGDANPATSPKNTAKADLIALRLRYPEAYAEQKKLEGK